MKVVLVSFAVFALAAGAPPQLSASEEMEARKIASECIQLTKVTDEELRKFKAGQFQTETASDNVKCLSKCFLEKYEILVNGQINDEEIYEIFSTVPKNDVEALLKRCKVNVGKDACDTAYKFSVCFGNNSKSFFD